MASSGSFLSNGWYSSSKGDYVYLEFAWSVTATSIENNTKPIYWELRGKRTASGYVNAGGFKVVIDGDTEYSKSTDYRIELRNGTIVASGKKTLTHKSDGTRSFDVSIQGGLYEYAVNCTGSKTFTLDTIPRASAITSAANVTLGNKCDVRWTPLSAAFRYKLEFSLGEWKYTTGAIHPNKTSAYAYSSYSIPVKVAEQIPNSYTGTMKVILYTYSNSAATTLVGSDSETFTVTVPTTEAPIVSMSLSPVHSLPEAFNGIYVQGLSKVKATLSAEPQSKASIRYYDMTLEGKTYGADDNYTSGYLTNSGIISVSGHAVDSRSYGGYTSGSVTVIPYAKPKIQNVVARRCDKNGKLLDSGTCLKITATRSYQPVKSNGVQKNFCKIRYRYKAEGAASYSSWTTILSGDTLSSDKVTTGALLIDKLDITKSYRVEVQAIDDIGNTSTSAIIVPTDNIYWHRDGKNNALGLGKYNEQKNALDSGWDIHMNQNKITDVADPVDDTDVVTLKYLKQYIDSRLAGLTGG